MHNYFLLKALNGSFNCGLLSFESNENKSFYDNTNISFSEITIPPINKLNSLLKIGFLKNGLRYFVDMNISKKFNDILRKRCVLVEFMDIHSEGYLFLKQYHGNKKKKVVIRAHTPWGILRKYYSSNEIKGVDSWFAFEREKKCFRWCDQITTPSVDLKNRIIELYEVEPNKITVIPNILDASHFQPIVSTKAEGEFIILHVGRFERAKGVETLVKSFIKLSKNRKNVKLINIGEQRGSSLDKCMKWIEEENLSDKVEFRGIVKYEELPTYYANADVVIVPSEIYESFSYTVAQGMACGKPVIASNLGGIPETVNYGNAGLLFEPANSEDLAQKIELLHSNNNLRISLEKKARKHAVSTFSMDTLRPKYIEYYQSLIA